jgi:glucose-6-phosphate isomerase
VDVSRASLPDDALTLDPLISRGFPEAFAAMGALERGAVANPDENRMVGHYWLRAPHLTPDTAIRAVIEATAAGQTFAADVGRADHPSKGPWFRNLVMEPAAPGPSLADAPDTDGPTPFFLDNTDPTGWLASLPDRHVRGSP